MRRYFIFGLILFLASCQQQDGSILKTSTDLHDDWKFSNANDSIWYTAQVPGVVHLDLLENELIDDPYWEDNEVQQRWIEGEDWIYQTTFEIETELLNRDRIDLIFEGLDTYAEVYLNEVQVFSANNMFRTWRVDVKHFLDVGSNTLKVHFQSPVNKNRAMVNDYPHQLPSGNEAADIPIKVASFTRKAAYHFGWDWGPRFVTSGIWRPVRLETWDKARIESVHTFTVELDTTLSRLRTQVEVMVDQPGIYQLIVGDEDVERELISGINQVEIDFEISKPKWWWSNGLGDPSLYEQQIQLRSRGALLDSMTDWFGIRTIELINEPDSIGTSFYFKLNGVPVFMKGANYIPQDVFLPRVSPDQYHSLIQSVKDANMNMLRVWGGGIYERDLFYELCDQNGILLWQDFMFANSLYPNNPDFQENVVQECIEQIKRLRSHPCIAIWCGNNEIEVAWKHWGWQEQYGYTPADSMEVWSHYLSIFHELIPGLVDEYHPGSNYTPTSPTSNWGTAENFNHGSMHYWGVWHGREPFESFEDNVGRFMVEYGFQSFPSMETLLKVIADSNLYWDSPMVNHRQKSYIGNGLILEHIKENYNVNPSFVEFVPLSQQVQAKGLEMAIQAHIDSRPHCMGTLFWQLNDCWPGPSWSVIDYYGNKKKAYGIVEELFSEAY